MPRAKIIRLNVTPETHVRVTQGDAIFFRIPEDQLFPDGLKRKKRLVKYNTYKNNLFEESRSKKFIMPDEGASVTFYVPVPKSWSKKKKNAHDLQPHQQKPDLDNFIKAMKDAIMKEDKRVYQYSLCKRWVNSEQGYIEIHLKR